MSKPLTRQSFDALFEVGGRDAAWEAVQQDMKRSNERAVADHIRQESKTIPHRIARWWSFWWGETLFCLAAVAVVGSALYFGAYRSHVDGRQELADCTAGKTLACQQAVADAQRTSMYNRVALYRTAYKEATGEALPEMEKGDE